MKTLVTGGLGYIGSHTVVSLVRAGYEVVIIDNLDNSLFSVLSRLEQLTGVAIKFYNVDVRDRDEVLRVFSNEMFDAVIHFAAKKSVSEALMKPLYYYDHNITGLVNILQACENYKVNNFVFSSSCTVYGEPQELPVTENTPIVVAKTPYGNTKRMGEELIMEYSGLSSRFKSIILRYFNPVGAHESGLIGELPNGIPSNLMPYLTQSAVGLRGPLQIFGSDYCTRDGTAIRDFIHVMDLAEAHVRSLDYLKELHSKDYDIFNVGTGVGCSVKELVNSFQNVNNIKLSYNYAPRRDGDIEQIWADNSKIVGEMKWSPKRDIETMCESAWKWQKKLIEDSGSRDFCGE